MIFFRTNKEIIIIFLTLFVFTVLGIDILCTRMNWSNWYGVNYELLDSITMLIVLLLIHGQSKDMEFLARRCLATLIVLAGLNVVSEIIELKNYHFYFLVALGLNLIYSLIYAIRKRN